MSAAGKQVLPGEHLHALRSRVRGAVLLPGDAGWDDARRAWQLLADQRLAAIVEPLDADDVAATVRAARRLGLRVAPQATGHAAGALGPLDDTVLLRTTRLDALAIDPETARARVGAGVTLGRVAVAAAAHGLAVVGGMAATVGVTGFSLGGGIGWFARSHGLAAAHIVSVGGVDARGEHVRADAAHHPELFWAARGSDALVVTELELQLHRVPGVWAGSLLWPLEDAADVAHAWREWTATVPEQVTSLARVLRYPPLPEVPEPVRGRSFVAVEVAVQADGESAEALLAPLRALRPALDTVREMSPADLASVHGDPPQPVPATGRAVVLSDLSPATVDAVVEAALSPAAGALVSVEVRQLGGMLSPGRVEAGAVSSIDGAGLLFAVGIVPTPEAREAVEAATAAVVDALAPYASAQVVKNFAETPAPATALYGAAADRVRRVVAAWDPEGVIASGHPLG